MTTHRMLGVDVKLTCLGRAFIYAASKLSPVGVRVFGIDRWADWTMRGGYNLMRMRIGNGPWQRMPPRGHA